MKKNLSLFEFTGSLDIETTNWTEFLAGTVLERSGKAFFSNSETDFLNYVYSLNGIYIAHNGGKFDFLYIIKKFLEKKIKFDIFLNGSRVLILSFKNVILIDTFALFPFSLSYLSQVNGGGKEKIKLDRSKMKNLRPKELKEYLYYDNYVLQNAVLRMQDFFSYANIEPALTLGSSILKTFNSQIGKFEKLPANIYRFLRKGYYGGRNEVLRTELNAGYSFDINASYPAQMVFHKFPAGKFKLVEGSEAIRKMKPGIYEAVFKIPESELIAPIPYRHAEKLYFPTGEFSVFLPQPEIIRNIKYLQKIKNAVIFETEDFLFSEFVLKYWRLRKQVNHPTINKFLKLWLNSLSGKLGESNKKSIVKVGEGKTGWKSLNPDGTVWEKNIFFIPPQARPELASYITSYGRIQLYNALENSKNPAYCDTDSLFCELSNIRPNVKLGGWKLEKMFTTLEVIQPKIYAWSDDTGMVHFSQKIKSLEEWEQLKNGTYTKEHITTFREGVSTNEVFKHKLTKKDLHFSKDTVVIGNRLKLTDGTTRPFNVKELKNEI